ncbi:MAG: hypothetical protein ACN6NW_03195 [Acinetobacter amyesii]|uniref:hypothetical protein n=1 Tax=Acinetobacter TaxID=469 RepID=UPI0015D1ECC6|nr:MULTISPECIES: hypothetical protein [unclassified Acinetobacter]
MKYLVKIIEPDIELDNILTIRTCDEVLDVFASYVPEDINYKNEYLVELEATVLDEYILEQSDEISTLRKIDNSLGYEIIGVLRNGKIYVNEIIFEDEILKSDFGYLDNKTVKWTVDRISLYFEDL